MLPTLRGRQTENLKSLRAEVMLGNHPLLVAPCGYGKGTLITYIVHSAVANGYEVIFAVRGKSLVADMSHRLKMLGIEHGVLMGDHKRERWHAVQVASIDTLHRMEHPPKAGLIIVDEAHMSLSPTWRKALARFPKAIVIGMTATPIGPGGKGLGRECGGLFDSMVLGPSVNELIAAGYLTRSRHLEPPPIEGAREVRLGTTDNLGAQAAVFDKVPLIGDSIRHYKEHAAGRKGVTFCADQKHAYHMAEQFTQAGIPWAYVDADTPMGDEASPQPGTRAAVYRDLDAQNGTLMGVSSVGCVSIGWDHPIVSYLGINRRTQSFQLWHQMMGRGSRIYPQGRKENFLIIDHAGNQQIHHPYGYFESEIQWSLTGRAIHDGPGATSSVQTCSQSVMNCQCGRTEHHDDWNNHTPCFGTFKAGARQCPYCGCPLLKKEREREIETIDGVLLERQRPLIDTSLTPGQKAAKIFREAADRAAGLKHQKRRTMSWLLTEAERKGHKAGWARHTFIARFGEPPPNEWMPLAWRQEHG